MSDSPLDPDTDPFKPPAIPTAVSCLHCGEEFDSYLIEWRVVSGSNNSPMGFWCCPTSGCDGKGFGFDIFPLDPDYRDENGDKMWSSDESDVDEVGDFEDDDSGDSFLDGDDEGDEQDIPF